MIFRQYELGCLSLYSYLIGDERTGRAVVVDPQRDVEAYVADAESLGLRIERVIETHFHADFLSGHLELADATGAVVSYGDVATADFAIEPLAHGERLSLGDVTLEIRHTPGHTPESISVVVWEHADDPAPWGVLTGDTLFIGDVGRPDLLASVGWSASELASALYRSLHDQLLTLPDATLVYPAHGAGSACGKAMLGAPSSAIGEQRRFNYALQPMGEEEFVRVVTAGQPAAPPYFAFAADTNRRAHDLLAAERALPHLDVEAALRLAADDVVLLDTRDSRFAEGHVAGSINVSLDGRFAEYAGDLIDPGQTIVVLADHDRAGEAQIRLARIGFDRVVGAVVDVERALAQRPDAVRTADRYPGLALEERLAVGDVQLVDVRNPGELEDGVIPGSLPVPLAQLRARLAELDPGSPTVVYCAGGHRSSAAASMLRREGFGDVADLEGGFNAWLDARLVTTVPAGEAS